MNRDIAEFNATAPVTDDDEDMARTISRSRPSYNADQTIFVYRYVRDWTATVAILDRATVLNVSPAEALFGDYLDNTSRTDDLPEDGSAPLSPAEQIASKVILAVAYGFVGLIVFAAGYGILKAIDALATWAKGAM